MKQMALLMLCVITSVCGIAQDKRTSQQMLRHEVTLGLGKGSLVEFGGYSFNDDSGHDFPMGNLHMQYLYNVSRQIGLGALLDFAHGYREVETISYRYDEQGRVTGGHSWGDKKYTEYFTLSPTARIYWFNNNHFAMYSRLGVGVVFGIGTDSGVHNREFAHHDNVSKSLQVDGAYFLE